MRFSYATLFTLALSALMFTAPASAAEPVPRSSASPRSAAAPDASGNRDHKPSFKARFGPSALDVEGTAGSTLRTNGAAGTSPNEQFRRAPAWLCALSPTDISQITFDCTSQIKVPVATAACAPGQRALDPLFSRVKDASSPTGWSRWTVTNAGGCVVDADFQAALAHELQRLPLTPSTFSVQPPSGWTLVNTDTIVYTDSSEQTLTTTVLGVAIAIRAVPIRFAWDFGDNSAPLATTDPGHPWPEYTIAHQYKAEGTRQIGLTTTWTATYQIAGTPTWEAVAGTATTSSVSAPLTVYEARSRLVHDSL